MNTSKGAVAVLFCWEGNHRFGMELATNDRLQYAIKLSTNCKEKCSTVWHMQQEAQWPKTSLILICWLRQMPLTSTMNFPPKVRLTKSLRIDASDAIKK